MNWFKHDYTASEDDKILEMRSIYGWQGYGIFYAILEYMCKTEKGIDKNRIGALRMILGVDQGYLEGYLEDTLRLGLFYLEGNIIYNQRIMDHLAVIDQKRFSGSIAGKKSAETRRLKSSNLTDLKVTLNQPSRLPSRLPATDKIRLDKIRVDKSILSSDNILTRPSDFEDPEMVQFFTDYGSTQEEATRFFNHYDSQGWHKSNNMPIHDWRSAARNWIDKSIHDERFKSKAKKEITMPDFERIERLRNEKN